MKQMQRTSTRAGEEGSHWGEQVAAAIWRHRAPLARLRAAIARGSVTLGFLGGSITEARPGHNWPEKVVAWLVERYPHVRFTVENAAIGATGSNLAVFRLERDILAHRCDIVFVEYAVNDYYGDHERRKRSREGLLRRLLAESDADLVLAYTYLQAMYAEMAAGEVPDSIAELEQLGERYNIGSVWMGLYALDEVRRGRMNWEEWLPDGLHPTHRGSYSYAQSVIAFLQRELEAEAEAEAEAEPLLNAVGGTAAAGAAAAELATALAAEETAAVAAAGAASAKEAAVVTDGAVSAKEAGPLSAPAASHTQLVRGGRGPDGALPAPLNARHWAGASTVPFADVQLDGPWMIQRSANIVWIGQMLATSAIGAKLRFAFRGRGLVLGIEFGKLFADLRCRIDGDEVREIRPERAEWCPPEGLYHVEAIAEELEDGVHEVELEVVHGNGLRCEGTRCRIAFIGVLP